MIEGIRVMQGFFAGKVMLYGLENRAYIGRGQKMKFLFAEIFDLNSPVLQKLHKGQRCLFLQHGQI